MDPTRHQAGSLDQKPLHSPGVPGSGFPISLGALNSSFYLGRTSSNTQWQTSQLLRVGVPISGIPQNLIFAVGLWVT